MDRSRRRLIASALAAPVIAACSITTDLGGFTSPPSHPGSVDASPFADVAEDEAATEDAGASRFCRPGFIGPSCMTPCPTRTAGAECEFKLVFGLDIPVDADWNTTADVPYSDNTSATIGSFTRIAYRLILDAEEVWVELDAFTADPTRLGVPVDWIFERTISNVVVRSFSPNQLDVLVPTSGNIEMWSNCYNEGADGAFDSADFLRADVDCYGSMQVHVEGRPVLCFNRWSEGSADKLDLGIGRSSTAKRADWTFLANSAAFTTRRLEVYVR